MEGLSAIGNVLTQATRRGRARVFANRYFRDCPTHFREAVAVHVALERLSGGRHRSLNPDVTITDVVGDPYSVRLAGLDLEEVTELVLALEAEGAFRQAPGGGEATREALNAGIAQVLLG